MLYIAAARSEREDSVKEVMGPLPAPTSTAAERSVVCKELCVLVMPFKQVPVLVRNCNFTLSQSLSILRYLGRKFGKLP